MARVNYYLSNKPDQTGKCLVLLYFSYDGKRVKVTTNESIHPKNWNKNSKRAKASMTGSLEFNSKLDDFSEQVNSMYRRLQLNKEIISPQGLKDNISSIINYEEAALKIEGFFSFVESFIEAASSIRKAGTVVQYKTTLKHLYDFQDAVYRKQPIEFDTINLDFYNDFTNYLTLHKGFSKNTIGKYLKNIKVFMNEATERGLNSNYSFKSKKFKVLTEDTDAIYLTESEINAIYNLDYSDNIRLDNARDTFLIGCWTGLRFSDLHQVQPSNIKNGMISIRTIKTDQKVVIPIHSIVQSILGKRNNEIPRVISNQKLNAYLKEIGEAAQLNEKVTIKRTVCGRIQTETKMKYELLTTHTARRSFATNLYLKGVPSRLIMMITGHRTEKAFLKYIKVSAEQEAERLQGIWNIN